MQGRATVQGRGGNSRDQNCNLLFVFHIHFVSEATPLNPKLEIHAPMPSVPRVGEEIVFSFRHNWPSFEVARVQYIVHHHRNAEDGQLLGEPSPEEENYEELIKEFDNENALVEYTVYLNRLETDASGLS